MSGSKRHWWLFQKHCCRYTMPVVLVLSARVPHLSQRTLQLQLFICARVCLFISISSPVFPRLTMTVCFWEIQLRRWLCWFHCTVLFYSGKDWGQALISTSHLHDGVTLWKEDSHNTGPWYNTAIGGGFHTNHFPIVVGVNSVRVRPQWEVFICPLPFPLLIPLEIWNFAGQGVLGRDWKERERGR